MSDFDYFSMVLKYEPDTGRIFWIAGWRSGLLAGTTRTDGYRQINVKGKLYLAHRIAWLLMTGEWPKHQIDHIDNNRFNDQWNNLREATHAQNKMNTPMQANNTTGFKGVYFNWNRCKFVAQIKANGTYRFLGHFESTKEAYQAYVEATKELHGEFARLS